MERSLAELETVVRNRICGVCSNRLSEPRLTAPRLTEPRLTEPRLTEPCLTEPRLTDPRLTEPRLTEPCLTEPRLTEPRLTEPRLSDPRLSDPRLTEPRPSGSGFLSPDLCGLENPSECALFRLFPQVAQAIQSTNSDNLQDYIDAIRQSVCTVCKSQDSSGDCESRQEVQCALDAYLLLVVEAIEEATGKSFGQPLPPATVQLV